MICQKRENVPPQSCEILQTFVCAPHHTNVYKILRILGAISLLFFILSLSNLATLLILKRFFQQVERLKCERLKKTWKGLLTLNITIMVFVCLFVCLFVFRPHSPGLVQLMCFSLILLLSDTAIKRARTSLLVTCLITIIKPSDLEIYLIQ